MSVVQFLCAKIGMVSMGLAGVLRNYYSRWLLYPTVLSLIVANTINAGTDIGAIAAAVNLLVPVPPYVDGCPDIARYSCIAILGFLPPHNARFQMAYSHALETKVSRAAAVATYTDFAFVLGLLQTSFYH
jgi:Natural resistance-associated macrophage protein